MNLLKRTFNLKILTGVTKFEMSTVGPVLSPYTNRDTVKNICEEINLATKGLRGNLPMLATLYLNHDHTFFFILKSFNLVTLLKWFAAQNIIEFVDFSIIALFDIFLIKYFFVLMSKSILIEVFIKRLFKAMLLSIKDLKIIKA